MEVHSHYVSEYSVYDIMTHVVPNSINLEDYWSLAEYGPHLNMVPSIISVLSHFFFCSLPIYNLKLNYFLSRILFITFLLFRVVIKNDAIFLV